MKKQIVVGRKISDVGSSELWNARMFLGVLDIKNHVFKKRGTRKDIEYKKKAGEFDKVYTLLLSNLGDAYKNITALEKLISQHKKDLLDNKILNISGNQYFVDNPIDQDVKILFRAFVNALATAIKQTQYVCGTINKSFDLAFLFVNDKNFNTKITEMKKKKEEFFGLLPLIIKIRPLSDEIIRYTRNTIEHPRDGFVLPDIEYDFEHKCISNDFYSQTRLRSYWENSWRFCEIVVVNAFASQIKSPWGIIEIPKDQRNPNLPIKYKPWITDEDVLKSIHDHINKQ